MVEISHTMILILPYLVHFNENLKKYVHMVTMQYLDVVDLMMTMVDILTIAIARRVVFEMVGCSKCRFKRNVLSPNATRVMMTTE